jgi:hypothetical protein
MEQTIALAMALPVPTKLHLFPADWRNGGLSCLVVYDRSFAEALGQMEDLFQMALVVVFAAVMLVTGQLFIEHRSSKLLDAPAVATVASR